MTTVYISYYGDNPIARQLEKELQRHKIKVNLGSSRLSITRPLNTSKPFEYLTEAHVLIVMIGLESIFRLVPNEIEIAKKMNKPILPVIIDNREPLEILEELSLKGCKYFLYDEGTESDAIVFEIQTLVTISGNKNEDKEDRNTNDEIKQAVRAVHAQLKELDGRLLELESQKQDLQVQKQDITRLIEHLEKGKPTETQIVRAIASLPNSAQFESDIFMVMPFRDGLNDVYMNIIEPLTKELSLKISRGDYRQQASAAIVHEVLAYIKNAKIILVECTEFAGKPNGNVYYELGQADALGKDNVILISQTNVSKLPFDIRHRGIIEYKDNAKGLAKLKVELKKAIQSILGS